MKRQQDVVANKIIGSTGVIDSKVLSVDGETTLNIYGCRTNRYRRREGYALGHAMQS